MRSTPLLLLGQGGIEPGAVHGDAVLGGELHGQVDREPVRVVEPERDLAGEPGGIGGQVLLAPTDDPLGTGQRDERLLQLDRAGIEGPGELGLLARDRGQDLGAPLGQVRDTRRP